MLSPVKKLFKNTLFQDYTEKHWNFWSGWNIFNIILAFQWEQTEHSFLAMYCCSIMRCIRTFLTYISQVCNERNKLDFFFLEYYYFIIQWCGMFDPILSKSLLFLSGICNRWLLMYEKALNQGYRKFKPTFESLRHWSADLLGFPVSHLIADMFPIWNYLEYPFPHLLLRQRVTFITLTHQEHLLPPHCCGIVKVYVLFFIFEIVSTVAAFWWYLYLYNLKLVRSLSFNILIKIINLK